MKTTNDYNYTSIFDMNKVSIVYGSFTALSPTSITIDAESSVSITKTFKNQVINSFEVWISIDRAMANLFKPNSTELTFNMYHLGDPIDTDSGIVAERFLAAPNSLERRDYVRYNNEWITQFPKNPKVLLTISNRFKSPVTISNIEIFRSQTVTEEIDTKIDSVISSGAQIQTINSIGFFPDHVEAQYPSDLAIWDYTMTPTGVLTALTRRSDGHVINITYN